jgi:hypothetical protein
MLWSLALAFEYWLAQVEQLEDSSREFCLDPGLAALIFQGMACETGM